MAKQPNIASWCDKLASTPSAGFGLNPHYVPATQLMEAFTETFNRLTDGDQPEFAIENAEGFNLAYTTNSGVQTSIDHTKVFTSFVHRMRAKAVSAGPPVLEMQSKPQPYTHMLPLIIDTLVGATLQIPGAKARTVHRVGIVTNTIVEESEAPPGIQRMLGYYSKPWGKVLGGYSYTVTAELADTANYVDRCIHKLTKPDTSDALLTANFDWQRIFKKAKPVTEDILEEISSEAEEEALSYFEKIAEGERF